MSDRTGVPGTTVPGHPALSRLISAPVDDFAAQYWGNSPLLSSAEELGGDFTDLLDADAVDELVSERGLRAPFLRVANNGSTLPTGAFTSGGGIGAGIADQLSDDKLVGLFSDGATLVLQALHRSWAPVLTFCQQLAAELGHPVQANAYITPPQNQGFSDHYDVHDVFVLQIDGEKEWTIHAPVLESPLRDQPWTDRRAAVEAGAEEPPVIKTVLRPGGCLYLPRGYLHAARALGGISTHLTIGVHSWTRYRLAEQLTAAALKAITGDDDLRASLPFGAQAGEPDTLGADLELARARLIETIRDLPAAELATGLRHSVRDAQRAAPIGPLRQWRALDGLTPTTCLRLRSHLAPSLDGDVLVTRAGRLALGAGDAGALQPLLDGQDVTAGELGEELSRRLLRAAVAVTSD